ncbi:MAG: fatty acid desaturase [Oligoflexales bacterium]
MQAYQDFLHVDGPSLDKALEQAGRKLKCPPKELMQAASWSTLCRHCLEEWLMIGVCWFGIKYSPNYLYPILALVISGRFHALGVILHEACHLRRSRKFQSCIVEFLAGYPIASTIEAMRYHHLRHHLDTSQKTDPYFKEGIEKKIYLRVLMYLRSFLLVPFWMIRPIFGVLSFYHHGLRNFYGHVFLQDKSKNDLRKSINITHCINREFGQLAFQMLLGIVAFIFPIEIFYGYIIPVLITAFTNGHRVIVEHYHEAIPNRSPQILMKNTRDHGSKFIYRFLFFPRNIGYHRMHHLFPAVRQELLPELTRWYQLNEGA